MTDRVTFEMPRHEAENLLLTLQMTLREYVPEPDDFDDAGGDPSSAAALARSTGTDFYRCISQLRRALGEEVEEDDLELDDLEKGVSL